MVPIRTTVVGSYPFPGWLEFATQNLNKFGAADIEEMIDDAVIAAIHDQVTAGLDVITDGEQTRLLIYPFTDLLRVSSTMKLKLENSVLQRTTNAERIT